MQDFRNLKVWQKAHAFVLGIYRGTGTFPNRELFGLRSQIRRACVAIPGNIAEGCGQATPGELHRYAQHAFSHACELEHFLLLAHDLTYFTDEEYARLSDDLIEVKKMLSGLLVKLTT
jgi:four helix bundle protein